MLALQGCGGGPDDGCPSALPAISLVSAALPADYEPVAGPGELYDQVDLVVEGTITNVADGRVIGASNDGPRHRFVVTVAPTKVYKAPKGTVAEAVHIEFHRATNVPASEFRDVIPDGTRVVLFGYLVLEEENEPVRNQFAGRAAGSPLYAAAPQGLFLGMDHTVLEGRVSLGVDQRLDGFTDLRAFSELPRPVSPAPTSSVSPSPACN